ncbi:hypothetical protein [Microcella sp.]|uniref:hypothetical protein n=1 Tax=Microcella sp. TaxID=1913979 RepID=UPI00391A954F
MPDDSALDPRYPRVFQRGGGVVGVPQPATQTGEAGAAPSNTASPAVATPAAGRSPSRSAAPRAPEVDPGALAPGATPAAPGRPPLELIVVGNPWMRALWAIGALAFATGLALAVAAEFGFSAVQATGPYEPEAFLAPRIAQVLALPFAIAGTVALVAATVLRIVAWRPAAVRDLSSD